MMPLRTLRAIFAGALFLAVPPLAHIARAADADIEADAKKLQSEAMDVDFVAMQLPKARNKLNAALKKCGQDKCSTTVLARLHRDLGIVLINAGDSGGGK